MTVVRRRAWLQRRTFGVMVLASGAFMIGDVAHEVLGHATACLADGGRITEVSAAIFHCAGGGVLSDLGGPGMNLLLALTAALLLRMRSWGKQARILLSFMLAFNMLWLTGCMLSAAFKTTSDFSYLLGLMGLTRVGRMVLPLLAVLINIVLLRWWREAGLSRRLTFRAYLAAGTTACISAAFYFGDHLQALQELALESFGSFAWLLFAKGPDEADPLAERDLLGLPAFAAWLAGAALFMQTLGRGILP